MKLTNAQKQLLEKICKANLNGKELAEVMAKIKTVQNSKAVK